MADLDGDGKDDLYTGCYQGLVFVLRGEGRGVFAAPEPLRDAGGEPLRAGMTWPEGAKKWDYAESTGNPKALGIAAAAIDWDADGDLDLVLGTQDGEMFLRTNDGTAQEPRFATRNVAVKAGGATLQVPSGHAMPVAADWDGDGRWDLVSGSDSGAVHWFRNVGERGAPAFAKAKQLVPPSTGDSGAPGRRSQACVADFDQDGRFDLLLGDYRNEAGSGGKRKVRGDVWLFRRTPANAGR